MSRVAAWVASRRPVSVLPVKLITGTSGLATIASPTSPPGPVTRLTVPAGKPASAISSTRSVAQWGVSLDGLNTTVLPLTRAGIIFQHGIAIGKFQGVMIPATPIGSRIDIAHLSGSSEGVVSPNSRRPSPAIRKAMSMPSWTSPRASARTLPISRVIARARRSLCSASRAPKRYRISPRLGAGVRRQATPAGSAARIARRDVGGRAGLEVADEVAGVGRVVAVERPAADRVDPFAGDEQLVCRRPDRGLLGRSHAWTRSKAIATEPPPPRHRVARP